MVSETSTYIVIALALLNAGLVVWVLVAVDQDGRAGRRGPVDGTSCWRGSTGSTATPRRCAAT